MQLQLSLEYRVISKKNSRRYIHRGGRGFFVPSVAFKNFEANAVASIWEQIGKRPVKPLFTGDMRINTIFYTKGKLRVDADNLHTSILDVLQKANIIADDEGVVKGYYEKHRGSKSWRCDILIEELWA